MRISGVLIKHSLIDRGMKQKDLAEKTELNRNTISAVCSGKSCSEGTARKIAEALGVTVDDLIERK